MNKIIVDIICHCRVEKAFGVAQRTHGTTDPGGVLAPRPSEGMLNNPLSTYAENGQCNRPTTNCIVFGTACLCLHWQPPMLSLWCPQYDCSWKKGCSFTARIRCAHVLYKTDTGHGCTWTKKKAFVHGRTVSFTPMNPDLYRGSWLHRAANTNR